MIFPFLSAMVIFMWSRFLLMMQLTKTFGPMLRILISMAGEVIKFIFIWVVVIVCLTSVSSLLFGELAEYSQFIEVIFTTFGASMGNYDLTVFTNLSIGTVIGEVFVVVVVIINNVVLLNFVIAIQADTYSKFTNESLGIYYDGIIARIPIYEDDSRYGGLIVVTPPFNALSIFMIPFYLLVKNDKTLKWGNDLFTRVMFAPLALIFTALFMAVNLLLLPFAYLSAIFQKVKLLRQ
mmetsp:Transcript_564/g.915  ORF Transcript_564/g.915 Transcript_564/m.915 type:complete len:236 (+) Transcript_564:879-1586(+)